MVQPPQVGVHHQCDSHSMERQRGDYRVDDPLSAFIGGDVGEAAESAPSRFQASGNHRPRDSGTPNGDADGKLVESCRQRNRDTLEQDGRGALFSMDPGVGLVHADVLARDLHRCSVVGTMPCREAVPRATAWVSSA